MEEFEDVKLLSTTQNGSLLLQLIKVFSLSINLSNSTVNISNFSNAMKSLQVHVAKTVVII